MSALTFDQLSCPTCWGLGETIREDTTKNGRLFCWPCPHECRPGGGAVVRTTVPLTKAQKMANKMRRNDATTGPD